MVLYKDTMSVFSPMVKRGAGKTYTMLGDNKSLGLIPRAVNSIYDELDETNFTLELRITEIYNEKMKDLISNDNVKGNELETTSVVIRSKDEIMSYINKSIKYRATESTDCNAFSSRSHSIYSLKLKVRTKGETIESMLNFIDLAGSERIKESHVEGKRLKETQNINKSLLSLKIVFNSIINKEKHVPYRDSKLTYLLKSSLENKSKVLMLLNVSLDDKDYNETLCSLRFGQVVNAVYVGRGAKQLVKEIE
ncbi:Kinesin (KAR3 subfamily) [Trachipleistophora hominis]|uniref:Kinesin-like protein n=1 Tax=Trachipleistophora hominis TaxID=72359 RepID=L7JWZ6_TRAHO|nr:Kinesin (KAR3 subfamily) [Trachipleistophora hominis]